MRGTTDVARGPFRMHAGHAPGTVGRLSVAAPARREPRPFRTIQARPKDLPLLSRQPESEVS
jgi:hypothetical protein